MLALPDQDRHDRIRAAACCHRLGQTDNRCGALVRVERLEVPVEPEHELLIRILGIVILDQAAHALPGREVGRRGADRAQQHVARRLKRTAHTAEFVDLVNAAQVRFDIPRADRRGAFGARDESLFLQAGGAGGHRGGVHAKRRQPLAERQPFLDRIRPWAGLLECLTDALGARRSLANPLGQHRHNRLTPQLAQTRIGIQKHEPNDRHERCALPQSREVSLEQGERQGDGGSWLRHTGRKRLAEHLLAQVGNIANQARRLDGPRRRDAQVELEQPIVGSALLPVQHALPQASDGGDVGQGVAVVIDVAVGFAEMAGAFAHGDPSSPTSCVTRLSGRPS